VPTKPDAGHAPVKAMRTSAGGLAALAIRRPTFIVCLVVLMLVVGVLSYVRLGVDQFPDVSFPVVSVVTPYRGVGPAEIETLVSRPIEEQISSISGIKHVSSISQDGVSTVIAEFAQGTDVKYGLQQVRDKVALARPTLPRDVDEPLMRLFDPADQPVIQLALSATMTAAELFDLADLEIRPRLEQVASVSVVELLGGAKREIHVDLDRSRLLARRLSVSGVSARIGANNQNVPVGDLSREGRQVLYRTVGEYRSMGQIRNVAVNFFGSEVPVTVGNLGDVIDSTAEVKSRAFFNGAPAIFVNVYRQSGSNTVAVVDHIIDRVGKINQTLKSRPGKPSLNIVRDNGKYVRMNVDDVRQTILIGVLLTILVVYLFLGNVRSTFITGMALPNSLIGTFILMYVMGFTINVITLLALSLAVGLLIDDAIVVRENIWRFMEHGASPKEAAIKGTNEVLLAVVATTLTVISVFLPVGFLSGTVGQFFKQLGFTVVFAMTISLFDALTMAPLLSAYLGIGMTRGRERARAVAKTGFPRVLELLGAPMHAAAEAFGRGLNRLTAAYDTTIRWCLAHRAVVLGASFAFFFLSVGVVGPRVKKTFIPSADVGFYQVNLEAAPGTSLDAMLTGAKRVEQIIRGHRETLRTALQVGNALGEPNVASVYVEMVHYTKRKLTTTEMKEVLRGELAAMASFHPVVGDVQAVGSMSPFTMNLIGDDLDSMAASADAAKAALSKIKGLVDLKLNVLGGKPEFQVVMDQSRARSLGVSTASAGMELRGMIAGQVAAKYREGGHEYDILVRLKEDQRDLAAQFGSFYVPNMNNTLVKLSNVGEPRSAVGPSKINRRDRTRYIQISGELGPGGALGNIQDEAGRIMAAMKLPKGVSYEFVGQAEDFKELMVNMVIAMGLGVLFMYMILASLYESVIMPFLIMLALPFAMVGALVGLYLTGEALNIFSMIAIIMLLGLVAKNSILLIDYTLQLMRTGLSRNDALIRAGKTRLRPILMTTVALIAGMLPLALGLSEVGRFRRSMGISVIGGLISSTALTLVVIPAAFEWVDRFRLWTRRMLGRPAAREIES